jgi:hypothetical protein
MKLVFTLLLLPMVLFLPSCGGQVESNDGTPQVFREALGNWTGTHKLMGSDELHDASYKVFMDGENLVHEFTSNYGGGFTGRESMHAHDSELHATWTDSQESEKMESNGSYDAASRTLTMTGEGADWEDPSKTVTYKHVTVYGEGTSSYTMTVIDPTGNEAQVMWIEMKKIGE